MLSGVGLGLGSCVSGWGRVRLESVMNVVLWLLSFGGDDCQFVTVASKASRAVDMAAIAVSKQSTALNIGANASRI